jgi:hypothetical protein
MNGNTIYIVNEDDLYQFDSEPPYTEGYVKKILPTYIHIPDQVPIGPCQLNPEIFQNLPQSITEEILHLVLLSKLQSRKFKQVYKMLQLIPILSTKLYLQFFPIETEKGYNIYFEKMGSVYTMGDIYRNRIVRMLYLTTRIHDILRFPGFDFNPYFLLEIQLGKLNPMVSINPWSIINGKTPKHYYANIELCENNNIGVGSPPFSFITGPVMGDIAWVNGDFINDSILKATSFHRPIIPLSFFTEAGLIKGEHIIYNEPTWINYTHLLQYIYGPSTTLFIGDIQKKDHFIFHNTLDPRFKPNKSM